ncbi:MAG: hypothetical protein R3E57_03660 [Porticoccaceae bacterium]
MKAMCCRPLITVKSPSAADGSTRQLASGDSFVVSQENIASLAEVQVGEETNPEFQELLAALNAGQDIGETQEATAAGEASGGNGAGDEIGQGLVFNLLGGEVVPTAGIDPTFNHRDCLIPQRIRMLRCLLLIRCISG